MKPSLFTFLSIFLLSIFFTHSADGQPLLSSGSGFFVSVEGHVLTNDHVIENCSTMKIELTGSEAMNATVAARDRTNDLALLRSSKRSSVVPKFSHQARVGQRIFVFGFPLTGFLSSSGNFTEGLITALTGPRDDSRLLQVSAAVQPGNSGGPLFDAFGNILGVIVGKIDALQNVNFAIKSSIAMNFLSANRILTSDGNHLREIGSEKIAELANQFTTRVLCFGTPPTSSNTDPVRPSDTGDIASYWTYNGSLFGLIARGESRRFVYVKPREDLTRMGVSKGTILFEGRKDGMKYEGTVRVFSKSCGATEYAVKGDIVDNDQRVILRGKVPILNEQCRIERYQNNVLVFVYQRRS
jgi:hypothetical protein